MLRGLRHRSERFRLAANSYRIDRVGPVGALHSEWEWRKVRKKHLIIQPRCQACGTTKKLEVHHIRPWHLFPLLRYALQNLVTLCRCCHFRFGHWLDWKKWNPEVKKVCKKLQEMNPTIVWE